MNKILETLKSEFQAGVTQMNAELQQLLAAVEQKKANIIATQGGIQAIDKSLERHAAEEAAKPVEAVATPGP